MSNDEYQHQVTWTSNEIKRLVNELWNTEIPHLKKYDYMTPLINQVINITIHNDTNNNI